MCVRFGIIDRDTFSPTTTFFICGSIAHIWKCYSFSFIHARVFFFFYNFFIGVMDSPFHHVLFHTYTRVVEIICLCSRSSTFSPFLFCFYWWITMSQVCGVLYKIRHFEVCTCARVRFYLPVGWIDRMSRANF